MGKEEECKKVCRTILISKEDLEFYDLPYKLGGVKGIMWHHATSG